MEVHILTLQARIMLWSGLSLLAINLYLQHDPLVAARRSALAAVLIAIVAGVLLRMMGRIIAERIAEESAAAAEAESEAATNSGAAR